MMIVWNQIFVLLPIIVIGIIIIIMMLSIIYRRDYLKHSILAVIGQFLAIASLFIIWNYGIQNTVSLIYIDNFSILYIAIMLFSSLLSSISVYTWLSNYPTNNRDEFYLLLLISSMGGVLLISANHLVMLFLGMELIVLPLFGLIGYSFFQKYSMEASIKYIILSGISSSFFLFGIALIYAGTGCLSFIDLKKILLSYNNGVLLYQPAILVVIGLAMMIVGFGFKLSFVPFHVWIPDVYQGAPSAVSMYLATGSKVAIIAALIRFLLILPDQYYRIFHIFLSIAACFSMLFGNLLAIHQNSIKRILSYSSIVHIGYLLIALIALRVDHAMAQESISIYLISYVLANVGAFGIIGIMSSTCQEQDMDILSLYRGLFWRNPFLSVVFTIIILSLAGIPITFGFIGKFYLLMTGINSQLWFLIIFLVLNSAIGMFFYLKIMINLYVSPVNNSHFDYSVISNWFVDPGGIVVIITAIFTLFFGLYPQPIIHLIHLIYL